MPESDIFDPDYLPRVMEWDDPDVLGEVYREFLGNLHQLMHKLREDTATDRVASTTHQLKSSASIVGAKALSEASGALEKDIRSGNPVAHEDIDRLLALAEHTSRLIKHNYDLSLT